MYAGSLILPNESCKYKLRDHLLSSKRDNVFCFGGAAGAAVAFVAIFTNFIREVQKLVKKKLFLKVTSPLDVTQIYFFIKHFKPNLSCYLKINYHKSWAKLMPRLDFDESCFGGKNAWTWR